MVELMRGPRTSIRRCRDTPEADARADFPEAGTSYGSVVLRLLYNLLREGSSGGSVTLEP